MWGKEKLGPILRKQGYATSNATVERIIGALIRRGTVQPVPALVRKVAARTTPRKRPHAIRKPKTVTFEKLGDVSADDDALAASQRDLHPTVWFLLQAGVDCSVIALWLGHESIETTQTCLHAQLALKEAALAKLKPYQHGKSTCFQPNDPLLAFLGGL